jgi:hypothetical protein
VSRPRRTKGVDRVPGVGGVAALLDIARRSERVVALVVGSMVLLVSLVAALGPALLAGAERDSLDRALVDAPLERRLLVVRALEAFGTGSAGDPLAEQRTVVEQAASLVPPEVAVRYGEPRLVVDTSRFVVTGVDGTPPASAVRVTLRVHPELDDHSRIVEGRAARPDVVVEDGRDVIEFELSTETVDVLGLTLGDVLDLDVDTEDVVTRRFDGGLPEPIGARLVGIRALDDADDPYWSGDRRLHRPVVNDTNAGAIYFAFGSVPADLLPVRPFVNDVFGPDGASEGIGPLFVEQRRTLLDGGMSVRAAERLETGLDTLAASAPPTASPGRPAVVAGLAPVLADERGQRDAARSNLAIAAAGVLGVGLVSLGCVLRVGVDRRRSWVDTANARGAARAEIVTAAAIEVAIVASVAALVGLALASIVSALGGLSTGPTSPPLSASTLVPVIVIGTVAATVWVVTASRPVGRRRVHRRARRSSVVPPMRVMAVGLVGIATVAALVTFLRRGVRGDVDPVAAAVPALVAGSAGWLVARLVPWVVGLVGRRGLRLGSGRLVGLRLGGTARSVGSSIVVVLVVATAVAVLGSAVDVSLRAGAATDDPLVVFVRRAHLVAAVVVVGLALVAVAALAIVTARRRQVQVGLLRLLGADDHEVRRAVRAELVPPVVVGTVTGIGVGWWIVTIVDGRLDLAAFGGGGLRPGWAAVTAAVGAVALTVAIVLAVLRRRIEHLPTSDVLRTQEIG